MEQKSTYIAGETIAFKLADASYTTVVVKYGSASVTATKTDGVWNAAVDTSALNGPYRFAIFADGALADSGSFVVCPLQSKWRAVVTAIESVIQTWGTNPNQTVTVGEISISAKSLNELLTLRDYYEQKAKDDEAGSATSFGRPRRFREVYR